MPPKAAFPRLLSDEILDGLAEDDPRAIRSRNDLRRINRIMGAAGILADALRSAALAPKRIIELGAGDGTLMLRLARRMSPLWPGVHVVLLDRQNVVDQATLDGLAALGWSAELRNTDIESWLLQDDGQRFDVAIANLFVHHFDTGMISRMFDVLAARVDMFAACEPRRGLVSLAGSRMIGMIGANDVTRVDAVLSVKAGFRELELSSLWPAAHGDWRLDERRAGLFSHLFTACRAR